MAEIEIFKLFLLVMVRFSGLMVSAPVLGSNNVPVVAKVGLALFGAILVTPTLPMLEVGLPDEPISFAVLAIGEFIIGLLVGFVVGLIFAAVQVGGQIMDLQTGFGMMNVFNPALETQFPIFGFFLFILAVLYMLVTNLHHLMIIGFVHTFEVIPIGGFMARPALLWEISRWGDAMFIDGLIIAAPVAASMMLAYATMGLIGRVIPQIQLFVVGFPLTIATGLTITALSVGIYLQVLDGMFDRTFERVDALIRGLG
ncbi:MAG: flagellar biosynthetic protein FliR [Gammaproteobacteria bacterium]|nr:flagellar biosynthetic protein FliR [Gammaproteobacteria bacterium]